MRKENQRHYLQMVIAILAMTIFTSVTFAAEKGVHLFILSGQSNMVGLDTKTTFIPAVEKEFGKDNVIVVKDAKSGMSIVGWYKNDKKKKEAGLYKRLMNQVQEAIKAKQLASVTFIWMQGERDAREKRADVYADDLKGLIGLVRRDMKRDDVNVVIGRISDFDMKNQKYQHWTKIREVQVKVAEEDKRAAWVNTDDLNDGKSRKGKTIKDDLHFSGKGYDELGTRFAQKAIELIKKDGK